MSPAAIIENGSPCISCIDSGVCASTYSQFSCRNVNDSRPGGMSEKAIVPGIRPVGKTLRIQWLACMLALLDILALRVWIEHCALDWRLATVGLPGKFSGLLEGLEDHKKGLFWTPLSSSSDSSGSGHKSSCLDHYLQAISLILLPWRSTFSSAPARFHHSSPSINSRPRIDTRMR
jgi:hypothetical protein